MKKQILIAVAFTVMAGAVHKLYGQETNKPGNKAGYDLATAKGCRVKVSSVDNGASISFNYAKIEYNVKSPRDVATGQSSGKRQHKPVNFIVSSMDNTVTEVKSPRDVATGQASGKVSYSDLSVMISSEGKSKKLSVEDGEFDLPGDLPDGDHNLMLSWSWGVSNSGASGPAGSGKVTTAFTVTTKDGGCMAIKEQGIPSKKK